jgi:hypothetical protein
MSLKGRKRKKDFGKFSTQLLLICRMSSPPGKMRR